MLFRFINSLNIIKGQNNRSGEKIRTLATLSKLLQATENIALHL